MAITLRVTSSQAQFMGEDAEVTFTGQCRVGRASHNDFVLNDPDRIVSSDHVTLIETDDQWALHDTSTNGTTINGQAASRGAPTALKSGDVLGIGTYEVEVVVSLPSSGGVVPGPTIVDPQFPDPGEPEGAPLISENPFAPVEPEPPADPFALPASPQAIDPFASPEIAQPADPFAIQEPPAIADPFGGSDPFGVQDPANPQPPGPGQDIFAPQDPFAAQPLAGGLEPVGLDPLQAPPGGMDPLPGIDQPPAGAADPQSLNPLDHFGEAGLDPLGGQFPGGGGSEALIPGGFDPSLGAQRDDVPADQQMFEPPNMVPDPAPFADSATGGGIPADWLAQEEPQLPPSVPAPGQPQPLMQAQPQPPAQPAANQAAGSNDLDALWRAAGIDPSTIDPAAAQSMGQILVVVVQGMMEVLRARAEIKNQFRLAMTMLKPADNNPLKLATTPQDALTKLFGPSGQGYQDPLTAFQEGFRDIRNHQVAMLHAMQEGFNAVQKNYDPDQLEQRFDRGLKRSSLLGVVNKTKYWELYRDMVDQLGDGDEAFRELFGETFAIAYEQQLARLSRGQ